MGTSLVPWTVAVTHQNNGWLRGVEAVQTSCKETRDSCRVPSGVCVAPATYQSLHWPTPSTADWSLKSTRPLALPEGLEQEPGALLLGSALVPLRGPFGPAHM